MDKIAFINLMRFPEQWVSLGMYPDNLFQWQLSGYLPGHEQGAEHDRNGAFHWWLRQAPSKEQLRVLLELAALDPDTALGNDVRGYIQKAGAFDGDLSKYAERLFKDRT